MAPVVSWFDSSVLRCWSTAGTATVLVVVLSLFSILTSRSRTAKDSAAARFLNHPFIFLFLISCTVLICRWWVVFLPNEVHPDETQMIAQALKHLASGPIPWLTVDGGTSGPLDSYILALPAFLGFAPGFATTRLVGMFCVIGTMVFTFLTLRTLFDDAVAKIAIIPMLVFYSLVRMVSYVHYSTEHLPVLLLAAAVYFLVVYQASEEERKAPLFLAGLAMGAAPFAKLQAGPVAAVLVLGAMTAVIAKRKSSPSLPAARHFAALFAGVLAVPALLFLMVLWGHALRDFWLSYVMSGLYYTEDTSSRFRDVLKAFLRKGAFNHFFIISSGIALLSLLVGAVYGLPQKRHHPFLAAFFLYALVNLYVVLQPLRPSFHYLLFLLPPITLLAGSLLGGVVNRLTEQGLRGVMIPLLVLSLALSSTLEFPRVCAKTGNAWDSRKEVSMDTEWITPFLHNITEPGDTMTIWGWKPKYFVLSGLVPGTREVYTAYQIMDTPLRDYYRKRFLTDMKTARPIVFMDAVSTAGWGYTDRKKYGYETFQELADFVRDNYTLVGELGIDPQNTDDAIRIYKRTDILTMP